MRLHERLTLTFGAGVTRVHAESTEEGPQTRDTWNAEAELARAFASTDVFLRIRQYDYSFPGFRNQVIGSPAGPAIAVGARFWLR